MEDLSKHLLSTKAQTDLIYWNRSRKADIEAYETELMMIRKYGKRKFYQRARQMNEAKLIERYIHIERCLTYARKDTEDAEYRLFWNREAVQQLQDSLTPFNGINLQTTQLKQLPLFELERPATT